MLYTTRTEPDAEPIAMPQSDQLVRLLSRAVQAQDERARTELTTALQRQLTGWLQENGCAAAVLDKAAAEAWSLFWRACTPARLAMLNHDRAVHHYLRACALAASPRLPWPVLPDPAALDASVHNLEAHDPREEAVIILRFAQGLTAAQIRKARPDLFATEEEVWQIARALLRRLNAGG